MTTLGNMKVHEITRDYGIAGLSITERAIPSPSAHQVLVRLDAVSLNYRDLLIINGLISQIGVIDGLKGEIEISKLMPKEGIVQGVQVGSREMFLRMNQAITRTQLHPIVNKIYPSSDIKEALTELDQGNHYGKICISADPNQS